MRSALSVIGTIGPPLTIVTSLMIYFGWARSYSQARLMGLDVSLFGYSTQDYILQSISTLFIPLMVVAAMGLGGLALHHRIEVALQEPSARARLRNIGRLTFSIGLLTAALAVMTAILLPEDPDTELTSRLHAWGLLLVPIALALGTAIAAHGSWLANAAHDLDSPHRSWAPSQRALRALLVGTLITFALFWALSSYAGIVGAGYAELVAKDLSKRPVVTAFSSVPLSIEAPGVEEVPIDDGGTTLYRTTGLRLLTRSGGRMFLLHEGWDATEGSVIVMPDNDEVRWQFSR